MDGLCKGGLQYYAGLPLIYSSASGIKLITHVFVILALCWLTFSQPVTPSFIFFSWYMMYSKCKVSNCPPLLIWVWRWWWWPLTGLSWKPYMLSSDYSWPHILGTIPQAHLLLMIIIKLWRMIFHSRAIQEGVEILLGPVSQSSRKVFAPGKPWQYLAPDNYRAFFIHVSLIRTAVPSSYKTFQVYTLLRF